MKAASTPACTARTASWATAARCAGRSALFVGGTCWRTCVAGCCGPARCATLGLHTLPMFTAGYQFTPQSACRPSPLHARRWGGV